MGTINVVIAVLLSSLVLSYASTIELIDATTFIVQDADVTQRINFLTAGNSSTTTTLRTSTTTHNNTVIFPNPLTGNLLLVRTGGRGLQINSPPSFGFQNTSAGIHSIFAFSGVALRGPNFVINQQSSVVTSSNVPTFTTVRYRGTASNPQPAQVGDVLFRWLQTGIASTTLAVQDVVNWQYVITDVDNTNHRVAANWELYLRDVNAGVMKKYYEQEASTGDWIMPQPGQRLLIPKGTNRMANTAVLVAGTVTVAHATVKLTDIIGVWGQTTGPKARLYISTRIVDTSFTIQSTDSSDTRTVYWQFWRRNP